MTKIVFLQPFVENMIRFKEHTIVQLECFQVLEKVSSTNFDGLVLMHTKHATSAFVAVVLSMRQHLKIAAIQLICCCNMPKYKAN
jgi:hypothetical protein